MATLTCKCSVPETGNVASPEVQTGALQKAKPTSLHLNYLRQM